jgi:transposase
MQDPEVQVWCEDEVHFQRHGTLTRMWAPRGQQPQIPAPSVRHKVAFQGALNIRNGYLLTQETTTFNAASFEGFIQHLLQVTQGKLCLILDNARWHHSQTLQAFFQTQKERLTLIFLPPYSPNLNPIERVWRLTRRLATHNRYFASLAELRDSVVSQFSNWNVPNSILKVLCARI